MKGDVLLDMAVRKTHQCSPGDHLYRMFKRKRPGAVRQGSGADIF